MQGEQLTLRSPNPVMEMLRIAMPSIVTMTSYTAMQFVDAFMVSKIGPDPVYIAAQFNGGMTAFVPIAVGMGTLSVVNTFASQNLGAGRPRHGSAYAWNGMWLALVWQVVLIPLIFLAPMLFRLTGHDQQLIDLETTYAQVLLSGAILTMASRGLSNWFYGMHMPLTVMVAALIGNTVNIGANYCLIFGAFGAPELGVLGAAIGTLIGTAVELTIPMVVFLSPSIHARFGTRSAWRPSLRHILDLTRIGLPAGLVFGNEMICWGYFIVILTGVAGAARGDDPHVHNAIGAIALRYMHMSFMPAVGLSIAVTAIVGRYIGAGDPDTAAKRTWLGMRMTMAYMGLCALGFVIFRRPLIGLFAGKDMDPAELELMLTVGAGVMILAAVFQIFDAMAIILSGALRGAGDTVWPGVMSITLCWTLILGGGHLLVRFAPQLGSLGPWIGAAGYIVLLGLALLWRFQTGAWRRIRVLREET